MREKSHTFSDLVKGVCGAGCVCFFISFRKKKSLHFCKYISCILQGPLKLFWTLFLKDGQTDERMDMFWFTSGPLLVHFWPTSGPLPVHFWSTSGPLLVHFWSASGSLSVHFNDLEIGMYFFLKNLPKLIRSNKVFYWENWQNVSPFFVRIHVSIL